MQLDSRLTNSNFDSACPQAHHLGLCVSFFAAAISAVRLSQARKRAHTKSKPPHVDFNIVMAASALG